MNFISKLKIGFKIKDWFLWTYEKDKFVLVGIVEGFDEKVGSHSYHFIF